MRWILTSNEVRMTLFDTALFKFYEFEAAQAGRKCSVSTGHKHFLGEEAFEFWQKLIEVVRLSRAVGTDSAKELKRNQEVADEMRFGLDKAMKAAKDEK